MSKLVDALKAPGRRFRRRPKPPTVGPVSALTPASRQAAEPRPAPPVGGELPDQGARRDKRTIALVVLVAALAVIVVLVLKPGGRDDEQDVRATLDRFAQATREKDYQTLCDELFAAALVEKLRAVGLPCEVAVRTGLGGRRNPQLEVLGVEVNGDQALARARSTAAGEQPSTDTLRLVREGGSWRIASAPGGSATP